MLLIYYTQYSIEFHCYKLLMLMRFNTMPGHCRGGLADWQKRMPLDFAAV